MRGKDREKCTFLVSVLIFSAPRRPLLMAVSRGLIGLGVMQAPRRGCKELEKGLWNVLITGHLNKMNKEITNAVWLMLIKLVLMYLTVQRANPEKPKKSKDNLIPYNQ